MGKLTDQNIYLLKKRIIDTLNVSDLITINNQLNNIKDSVLITGVGGSSAVCEFSRKVLEFKNNCISKVLDPRDLYYNNISIYNNVLAISYSGNNYGVKLSFQNNLNKYLLTNNNLKRKNINMLVYGNSIEKEKSFISLATTLMPITILLNYYLEGNNTIKFIDEIFDNIKLLPLPNHSNITIIYGNESSVSAKFLESSFIEAGIANVMLCTKYNYCHGQTTLPYHLKNTDMIFFKNSDNELDQTIINEAQNLYDTVIVIENDNKDFILSDFNFLIQSIYFIYEASKKYKRDLSNVKYAPAVKKLYHFEGSI